MEQSGEPRKLSRKFVFHLFLYWLEYWVLFEKCWLIISYLLLFFFESRFRNSETVNFWRPCAAIFGGIFFVRFCLQIIDFVHQYFYKKTLTIGVKLNRFIHIFSAKFVLEVCGGGGALWGSMETLGLRNPENQDFWRFSCSIFLCIFFARFVIQARDYLGHAVEPGVKPWVRLVQIFSAKFVLEVLGGAGAIWGWSEVITWRNAETIWFWRPISLTVGAVFFCRWILQICDYVGEMPNSKLSIPQLKHTCCCKVGGYRKCGFSCHWCKYTCNGIAPLDALSRRVGKGQENPRKLQVQSTRKNDQNDNRKGGVLRISK